MDILLNGNPIEIEGIDAEVTILQLIKTVEESLQGTGATIVDIFLDEQAYSPDDVEKLAQIKAAGFNRIEMIAATAQEMVQAAFEDGEAGISHLEEIAHQASSELRIGKIKSAMDQYIQFVDGIDWLVTMLNHADRAFAANMAESALEADRQRLLARLSEQMAGVKSSQESEDWVGVADILEYEFPEIFADVKKLIKSILENQV